MKKNFFPLSFLLLLVCLCSRNNSNAQNEAHALPELKSVFINGDSTHYIDIGKGDPVVFIHGALSDYRTWRNQIDAFARNHRAISYSRRYAWPNQQTIIDSSKQALASHVKDLAVFLKALKLQPAHLVGHSSGAFIALLTGMEHPELVRSLTLGEPPVLSLFPAPAQKDTTAEQIAEAFMNNEPEKAIDLFVSGAIDFSRFSQLDREIQMMNTQELRAIVFVKDFLPTVTCKDLEKISAPVLLLSGDKSPGSIFNSKLEPCLSNKEKATLDTNHGLEMENPSEFNKVVLGFIDRHWYCMIADEEGLLTTFWQTVGGQFAKHLFKTLGNAANKSIAASGLEVKAIGCNYLSAVISADEQSQAKVLDFNFKIKSSSSCGRNIIKSPSCCKP